uniref:Uncharacterized protein n=1 Tax=Timema bartmani TaxID=61472 RepID=A0A7R9HZA0_9NEOP|nr:unnamed protein product [Timema bartmani]
MNLFGEVEKVPPIDPEKEAELERARKKRELREERRVVKLKMARDRTQQLKRDNLSRELRMGKHAFAEIMKKQKMYHANVDETLTKYKEMKEKDDRDAHILEKQTIKMDYLHETIHKVEQYNLDLQENHEEKVSDLKYQRKFLTEYYCKIRDELKEHHEDDYRRLKLLSIQSNMTTSRLQKLVEKIEKILKLAAKCRKFEMQKEKVIHQKQMPQFLDSNDMLTRGSDFVIRKVREAVVVRVNGMVLSATQETLRGGDLVLFLMGSFILGRSPCLLTEALSTERSWTGLPSLPPLPTTPGRALSLTETLQTPLMPRKGRVPDKRICKSTPADQMSAGLPYCCLLTTSGAMKCGVPTRPKHNKTK